MNKRLKILMRRLEIAANTLSAGCFSGSVALLYRDSKIDYTYVGISVYLFVVAIMTYAIMTWVLMDYADRIEDSKSDVDSG